MRRRPGLFTLCVTLCIVAAIYILIGRLQAPPSRGSLEEFLAGRPVIDFEEVPSTVDLTAFLTKMYERSLTINSKCLAGYSKMSHARVLNFIVTDPQQSILFCPIYKSASSTFLIAMLEMKGKWGPQNEPIDLNSIRKSVYKTPAHFNPSSQTRDFHTRFMVVRHPFERLLSCYRDKYENANKKYYYDAFGKKMLRMFRENSAELSKSQINSMIQLAGDDPEREAALGNIYANPVGPTFSEFVQYVVGPYADDEHWRPYHEHCAPCSIQYNFILRFEDISEEGDLLLRHLRAPEEVHQHKVNVYSGPPTGEVSCLYYPQLSHELFEKLVGKYEPDLQLFGYSPDIYQKCAVDYPQ